MVNFSSKDRLIYCKAAFCTINNFLKETPVSIVGSSENHHSNGEILENISELKAVFKWL